MLQDPKARAKVAEFHAAVRAAWATPRAGPRPRTTRRCSRRSRRAMVADAVDGGGDASSTTSPSTSKGTFQDLMTKPVAFVNKDLAPIYGLTARATAPTLHDGRTWMPTQRAGVFTHAGFLASYSSYNRTSPILRGAFLEKQVLCTHDRRAAAGRGRARRCRRHRGTDTNREQVDRADRRGAACAGCHAPVVNPAGFALEAYDSIGALADDGEGHRRRHRQHGRRRHRRQDRARDRPGRPDDEDRRLARGAELLRAAAGARSRTSATLTNQDVCTVQMLAGQDEHQPATTSSTC